MKWKLIHERALSVSTTYRTSEAQLMEIIEEVEREKVYEKLNYPSLYQYCREELKLSESMAMSLIRVSRKALEIPELKEAVKKGDINVNTARKILKVIKPENQAKWINLAIELPQKQLEREVAKEKPQEAVPDRIKPLSETLREFRCAISDETEADLERVKNLLCQKTKKPVNLGEMLSLLSKEFLKRHDPIQKAQRNIHRKPKKEPGARPIGRAKINAKLTHEITLRDKGKCQFGDCKEEKWTEVHHKIPVARGGRNELSNLITLCSSHHKWIHREKKPAGSFGPRTP